MSHTIELSGEDLEISASRNPNGALGVDLHHHKLIEDDARTYIPSDRLDAVIAALMSVRSELGLDDTGRGRRPTAADQTRIVAVATKIRSGDLTIRAISEHRIPQGVFETIFLAERGKQPVVANIMLPVDEARQGIHGEKFVETGPVAEVKFDG